MLSYFKVLVTDRLLVLLLLLVLFFGPAVFLGLPITQPMVWWMTAGERMAAGHVLYKDVWTELAPVSALLFYIINLIGGKWYALAHGAGLIIWIFLTARISTGLEKVGLYPERNLWPSVVLVVLLSQNFAMLELSPPLLALVFLMLMMERVAGYLYRGHMNQGQDEVLLATGVYAGMAGLCYLPAVCFIIVPLLGFLLHGAVSPRQYLLLFIGFLVPQVLAFLVFFWLGAGVDFYYNYWEALVSLPAYDYVDYRSAAYLFAPALLLFVVAVVQLYGGRAIKNYHNNMLQVYFIYLLACFFAIGLAPEHSPHQYVLFLPAIVFVVVHFLAGVRKRWIMELAMVLMLVVGLGNVYYATRHTSHILPIIKYENLVLEREPKLVKPAGVLVLGQNAAAYLRKPLATPYLNTHLARRHFNDLEQYSTILNVFMAFDTEMPSYIYDEEGVMPALMDAMPVLAMRYKREGNTYRLKGVK